MSLLLALTAVAPPEPPAVTAGGRTVLYAPAKELLTDDELNALLVALLVAA